MTLYESEFAVPGRVESMNPQGANQEPTGLLGYKMGYKSHRLHDYKT